MAPPREIDLPAANKIFVDREAPQLVFEKAVFAVPNDRAIMRVFYGVGGQGKTELCKELMRKTEPSGDHSYAFLRRAVLDLHGKVKTEPDLLLIWIRNAFAEVDIAFPCFDLALAVMWEEKRREQPFPTLTKPWLGRAIAVPGDTAKEAMGDAVASLIPGAGFVLKRLGTWAIEKSKREYLLRTREVLQKIYHNSEFIPAYEI